MDVEAILDAATPDTMFYICGPARLIEAVIKAARKLGISGSRLQYESFE